MGIDFIFVKCSSLIVNFWSVAMSKIIVQTDKAPAAIGPYSQGVIASCGQIVFISGQIPLIPESMELITGNIKEQTERVMQNLEGALNAAGCSFDEVVRTTIFLKDMNDFAAVNDVYATRFTQNPPARACVEVSRLPKDVDVEIDCIAVKA
jgi:2-iminobutanoate/2-iminopropanoate deaminase